jgi:hypothetical protein
MAKDLYKTTIVIWSEYSPDAEGMEITDIAYQAMVGDAYCSSSVTVFVKDPMADSEFPDTEFFDTQVDEENEDD